MGGHAARVRAWHCYIGYRRDPTAPTRVLERRTYGSGNPHRGPGGAHLGALAPDHGSRRAARLRIAVALGSLHVYARQRARIARDLGVAEHRCGGDEAASIRTAGLPDDLSTPVNPGQN